MNITIPLTSNEARAFDAEARLVAATDTFISYTQSADETEAIERVYFGQAPPKAEWPFAVILIPQFEYPGILHGLPENLLLPILFKYESSYDGANEWADILNFFGGVMSDMAKILKAAGGTFRGSDLGVRGARVLYQQKPRKTRRTDKSRVWEATIQITGS